MHLPQECTCLVRLLSVRGCGRAFVGGAATPSLPHSPTVSHNLALTLTQTHPHPHPLSLPPHPHPRTHSHTSCILSRSLAARSLSAHSLCVAFANVQHTNTVALVAPTTSFNLLFFDARRRRRRRLDVIHCFDETAKLAGKSAQLEEGPSSLVGELAGRRKRDV